MATLIERPHIISYSKNDIRYVFQLEDLERPGLYLQVQAFCEFIDQPAVTLDVWDLKPDKDGKIYLYIQSYIDSVLSYDPPIYNSLFTSANSQICAYTIQYRELEAANQNNPDEWPAWTVDDLGELLAIKGGIEKHKHARNNIFVNYLDTQKPFLTWIPSQRFIYYDEPVTISFLNYRPDGTNGTTLHVLAANRWNGIAEWDIPIEATYVTHIQCSPQVLGINSHLEGDLYYYEVSVLDGEGGTFINPYRFYIEYRPSYHYYDMVYQNSLGGFDFVRVRGDIDQTFERTLTETDGGFNLNAATDHVQLHETKYTGLTVRRKYKADIGYQRSRLEQASYIELLVSTKIYHLINSKWVPVLTLQKDQDLGYFSEPKKSFPIEWALAESNEVYTPIEIDFGSGDSAATCVPVSTGYVTPPDATVGQSYNNQVAQLFGTPPFSAGFNSATPEWLNIGIEGDILYVFGTPTETGFVSVNLWINNDCGTTNISVEFNVTECIPVSLEAPETLPDAVINTYYEYIIPITSGSTPVFPGGMRPYFLDIDVTEGGIRIFGTPDVLGTWEVQVYAGNACSTTPTYTYMLNIGDGSIPGSLQCGTGHSENDMAETTYHDYGYYYLNTVGKSLMFIAWDSGARPNRFTIYNETDNFMVDTTAWVGDTTSFGPWGATELHTATNGTMSFAPEAGKIYKLQVEAGPASTTDAWTVTLTCT